MSVDNVDKFQLPVPSEEQEQLGPVLWTADHKCVIVNELPCICGAARPFLAPVLAAIDTRSRKHLVETITFPDIIGDSIVVRTTAIDDIVWAQREGKIGLSRMVRGRLPEPTRDYTVVLGERTEVPGTYVLLAAWFGPAGEIEPCDFVKLYRRKRNSDNRQMEMLRARRFWQHHAFCLDFTRHNAATITRRRPWQWGLPPDPFQVVSFRTQKRML